MTACGEAIMNNFMKITFAFQNRVTYTIDEMKGLLQGGCCLRSEYYLERYVYITK